MLSNFQPPLVLGRDPLKRFGVAARNIGMVHPASPRYRLRSAAASAALCKAVCKVGVIYVGAHGTWCDGADP